MIGTKKLIIICCNYTSTDINLTNMIDAFKS